MAPPSLLPLSTYSVAPHLDEFSISRSVFAASHAQFTDFVVAAFIFSNTSSSEPRVLILQRSFADSYGGYWDFPGGMCETSDLTLLDGVVREVFEETGYHVSQIRELVTVDTWRRAGRSKVHKVAKFSFIVEIHEAAAPAAAVAAEEVVGIISPDSNVARPKGGSWPAQDEESINSPQPHESRWENRIRLAESEHQAYLWATEEEIQASLAHGGVPYKFMGNQGLTILKAFGKLKG